MTQLKKNRLKEDKAKAGQKKKRSKPKFQPFARLKKAWTNTTSNPRVQQFIGTTLLLLSAYLCIAFTSFIFTWKVDQDKVFHPWFTFLTQHDLQVENWLGKLGALVSHRLIHAWFGLSAFLWVPTLIVLGLRSLGIKTIALNKLFKILIFCLLWIPFATGYIFQKEWLFIGGGIGHWINLWMEDILGRIGAGFLIAFSLLSYLILGFGFSFSKVGDVISRWTRKAGETVLETEGNEETDAIMPDNKPSADEDNQLPSDSPLEDTSPVEAAPLSVTELPELDPEPTVQETAPNAEESAESTDEASSSIALSADVPASAPPTADGEAPAFNVEAAPEEDEVIDADEIDEKDFGEYDPKLDLGDYELPSIELLEDHGSGTIQIDREELEANNNRIVQTLNNYNIQISEIKATVGPAVTLYEIIPAAGVRISKIKNLEDDIALSLSALGIRIIAPIPGKGTIGIEVPNRKAEIVAMKNLIASEKFQQIDMDLPIALGKTIMNETYIADLASMPHLLMAGATGQGKSVGLNTILVSLLYKKHPSQIKFVLVDPKKVELTLFNLIEKHFLAKLPDSEEAIITDTSKVVTTLNSLCVEMDQRYELLKQAQVRNIKEYNAKFVERKLNPEKGHRYLPYIVLVVDEFADLIMTAGKEVETPIARLAQLARAIGIHLIIATQRPSVNIITGTIKANFPARIAFRVTSKIDSRTILDAGGAEQLIGKGDMLLSTGSNLTRIQCSFVSTKEVENITRFIGDQRGYPEAFLLPEYVDENASSGGMVDEADRDALFEEAARMVVRHQQGSASLLQRRLQLGYNRAGRIIDQLEAAGIVGPSEGSKARQVLFPDEYTLEQFLQSTDE